MQAATRTKYGPPDVLLIKEVPTPTPKDNEVLVKVYATTVNRTDCSILWGKPFVIRFFTGLFKPSSSIPGTDFAGKVEAVGKNVRSFNVGDRVWGLNDEGLASHAQYITIREDKAIAIIPGPISYDQAAASAEGAHYAYNFISKVKLRPGQKVLVYGASGAIGSAAVQLLKHFGIYVTAVCNTENIERIKSLGPDRVIDYKKEDFTADPGKYDFVFDAVGKSSFGQCKPLLSPRGIYISSELGPGAENLYLPLTTALKGGKRVIFPLPVNTKRSVLLMTDLLQQGKFKPLIDRKYPFTHIADAYSFVVTGQKTGNVIITWHD
jgi:NADPH:quinone reductase-like Zn-dependent oxidoreductase